MSFTAYSKWGFLQRICHTVKLSILVKLLNFPLIHFFKSFFFIALLSPRIQYFCNTFSHLHLFSHFLRHGLGLRLDWTFKSSELLLWNEVFSLTLISIYVWETESVFIHANSESYMLKLFCFPNTDDNLDICIYGLAHLTLYRNWHAHKSRCKKWPSSSLKKNEEKKSGWIILACLRLCHKHDLWEAICMWQSRQWRRKQEVSPISAVLSPGVIKVPQRVDEPAALG